MTGALQKKKKKGCKEKKCSACSLREMGITGCSTPFSARLEECL